MEPQEGRSPGGAEAPTGRRARRTLRPLAGPGCFAIGSAVAVVVAAVFKYAGRNSMLNGLEHVSTCGSDGAGVVGTLRLFAARSTWLPTVVLEAGLACLALALAGAALAAVGMKVRRTWQWWVVLLLGVGALVYDYIDTSKFAKEVAEDASAPFLSALLATLPDGCDGLRATLRWTRLIGEVSGIVVGVAMCVTAIVPAKPTPEDLRQRLAWLQRLLYASSLMLVAGIMMSRANFTWVLAHWQADAKVDKALAEVIRAGVVESGVGYSALLAGFFLPVRTLLGAMVEDLVSTEVGPHPKARKKWLAANDLASTWQEDARHILALLAPVLSAPVFDALAKAGG